MKILTIAGTRPELIRLSIIIEKLDKLVDHIFVYTNQNHDYNLSTRFFEEMKIRKPDYYFKGESQSFGEFFGFAVIEFEKILKKENPDKILILGDTNSGLLSIVAEKYKIPVYHMEAGNRCFSEDTQVFTNYGWKFFYELNGDEKILTRLAGGKTEWSPILEQQKYHYQGEMYNLIQKGIDILVTPDHKFCLEPKKRYSEKCLRYKGGSFDYIFRTIDEFNGTKYYIPKTFIWDGDEKNSSQYDDDFIRLFGWYITEGCCYNNGKTICIYQTKNTEHYNEIVQVIKNIGGNPKLYKRSVIFNDKKLYEYFIKLGKSHEKYIPTDIKELSPKKLGILIDTMIKGDGTKDKHNIKYYTSSDKLASDFQEISYKAGYNCEMSKHKGRICELSTNKNIGRDLWNIRISNAKGQGSNNRIATYKKKNTSNWFQKINYDGYVYDITVNNHTIWVKRNNKCIWSSNCYDNRLPEETNRKIIDSVSKYNLPYTDNSKENLIREGFHKNFVFKIGNPINEVIMKYWPEIKKSVMAYEWDLQDVVTDKFHPYVLATFHRSENVDNKETLKNIIEAINIIDKDIRVVVSLHPRTKNKIEEFGLSFNPSVLVTHPLGFFDFVHLERNAKCVISDSGTVQEECCMFQTPALTIRETTERQETIECGSNILCGTKTDNIVEAFKATINRKHTWSVPDDYVVSNVSDTVINILLGKS